MRCATTSTRRSPWRACMSICAISTSILAKAARRKPRATPPRSSPPAISLASSSRIRRFGSRATRATMRPGRRSRTPSPAATKRARAATSPQPTASATSWRRRASSSRTSRAARPRGAARNDRCFSSPHERGCSMTTTKTRCDLLIRNAYVLTMDAKGTAYPDGAIAVDGRKILAVGPEAEVTRKVAPLRIIDAGGSLVHPGLIDLHYHATFHMVGKMIEERDTSKEDPGPRVAQQYTGLINAMGEEEEHANALLACLDMARNGVTAFLDPGTAQHPDAIAAAAEAIGIRASV